MELDPEGKHAGRAYAMLASPITPRPIAWVTTLAENDAVNAAPFSFFNAPGVNPPIIGFAPGDRGAGSPIAARAIASRWGGPPNDADEIAVDLKRSA